MSGHLPIAMPHFAHNIQRNDTLESIAAFYSRDPSNWHELLGVNTGVLHLQPNGLVAGFREGVRIAIPMRWALLQHKVSSGQLAGIPGTLRGIEYNQGWEVDNTTGKLTGRYQIQKEDFGPTGGKYADASKFADYWMTGKNCGTYGATSCINQVNPAYNGTASKWWGTGNVINMPQEAVAKARGMGLEAVATGDKAAADKIAADKIAADKLAADKLAAEKAKGADGKDGKDGKKGVNTVSDKAGGGEEEGMSWGTIALYGLLGLLGGAAVVMLVVKKKSPEEKAREEEQKRAHAGQTGPAPHQLTA